MPVSVVVGGQYGSEGKGKVAHYFSKQLKAIAGVKVSGTNSGHTVYDSKGNQHILRCVPSACVEEGVHCVIAPGALVELDILLRECVELGITAPYLHIHPNTGIITPEIKSLEKAAALNARLGSTQSGTGIATVNRIKCDGSFVRACDIPELRMFLTDTAQLMRSWLNSGKHIVIEGGQGFGLSLYHTHEFPYCTSRDTTAASFLGDAGLSPFDVENVIQVLRSYEIRVAGNSGPMFRETDWETVTKNAHSETPIIEMTSVTKKIRRVGYFDCNLVRNSVRVNKPNITVINFMDYIYEPGENTKGKLGPERMKFIRHIEESTGCRVTHVGFDGRSVVPVEDAIIHF